MTEHEECEHCGRPVDAQSELTYSQSIGYLCATCVEERVWK